MPARAPQRRPESADKGRSSALAFLHPPVENRGVDFFFFPDVKPKPKPDELEALFPRGTPEGDPAPARTKPQRPTTRARARRDEAVEANESVTLLVRAGKNPGKYTIPWKPKGDLNHYLNQAGVYADVVKSALRCYDQGNYELGKLRPRYVPKKGAVLEVVGPQASPIATRQPVPDKPVDRTIVAAVPIAGVRGGPTGPAGAPAREPDKSVGLLGFEQESL